MCAAMAFDPLAPLFDPDGRASRRAIEAWEAELMALFLASPEATAADADGSWIEVVLELALSEREVVAHEIGQADLEAVLLETFPLKVVCAPADAPGLVAELVAFWRFLDRAFRMPLARECLATLEGAMLARLEDALADTRLFGGGKAALLRVGRGPAPE
jgi:hypothetical protein